MSGTTVVVASPAGEGGEVTAAAPEAVADGAVEIAQIDADRSVAVATIHAETDVALAEIAAENDEEDIAWLRGELASLRELSAMNAVGLSALEASMVAMSAQQGEIVSGLATILASQTPPPPLETPPVTETVETPAAVLDAGAGGLRDVPEASGRAAVPAQRIQRRWL